MTVTEINMTLASCLLTALVTGLLTIPVVWLIWQAIRPRWISGGFRLEPSTTPPSRHGVSEMSKTAPPSTSDDSLT